MGYLRYADAQISVSVRSDEDLPLIEIAALRHLDRIEQGVGPMRRSQALD